MADLFGSANQPSLFPLTVQDIRVSKEEYRAFYKDDRALFRILLELLHRDMVESRLVMGFLLWLERERYTSHSLGKMFVNSLSLDLINQVADEVVICINLLLKKANNFMSEGSHSISHLQYFLDRKHIHLEELYQIGDLIFHEVSCIANYISVKAFDDILQQFIIRLGGIQMTQHQTVPLSLGGLVGAANQQMNFMQNYIMARPQMIAHGVGAVRPDLVLPGTDFGQSAYLGKNQAYASGRAFIQHTRPVEREPDEEVPPDDRTIFLTFSKGYPLSEDEVIHYFTSMFGDFIQSLHMQPVDEPDTQPLFARLVVRNPSFVRAVIERDGPQGKSKYIINGKHVWARKFIPRAP